MNCSETVNMFVSVSKGILSLDVPIMCLQKSDVSLENNYVYRELGYQIMKSFSKFMTKTCNK
jgi:hypothetical protein